MEQENKTKTGETTQITFKLTADDRQTIQETADSLELNVSEYCRIKCLADENAVMDLRQQVSQLQKENKALKVQLSFYKNTERDENSIILKLTAEQNNVIEDLYKGFSSSGYDLSDNIIDALITFPINNSLRNLYFSDSEISADDIQNAFRSFKKEIFQKMLDNIQEEED